MTVSLEMDTANIREGFTANGAGVRADAVVKIGDGDFTRVIP